MVVGNSTKSVMHLCFLLSFIYLSSYSIWQLTRLLYWELLTSFRCSCSIIFTYSTMLRGFTSHLSYLFHLYFLFIPSIFQLNYLYNLYLVNVEHDQLHVRLSSQCELFSYLNCVGQPRSASNCIYNDANVGVITTRTRFIEWCVEFLGWDEI